MSTLRFNTWQNTGGTEVTSSSSLPAGVIAYTSLTNGTGYSAGTAITIATLSATIVPGKNYLMYGRVCCQSSSANNASKALYVEASGMTSLTLAYYTIASGTNLPFYLNGYGMKSATEIGVTSGSGTSVTFTLKFLDSGNGGGLSTNPDNAVGANSFPQQFWIEEVGPT